jgi:hypothetical protein
MANPIDVVRVADARAAMAALIESRSMPYREEEPSYPLALAQLAWLIADAMQAERRGRDGKRGGR